MRAAHHACTCVWLDMRNTSPTHTSKPAKWPFPSRPQALCMLVDRCERDVRACINTVQFMAKRSKTITTKVGNKEPPL